MRHKLGFRYWSLSKFVNTQYIENFESVVVRAALNSEVVGVVCGHIHYRIIKYIHGIVYANTGDWVENCSVMVEFESVQREIIRWVGVSRAEAGLDEEKVAVNQCAA